MADMIFDAFGSLVGTAPMIIGLIALVVLGIVWYMWRQKVWIFKWWGAVNVPCVLTHEGNRLVQRSDKLKMNKENNRLLFESKTFGDKFDGTHLQPLIQYGKGATMLPVFRVQGEWYGADTDRDQLGKMKLKPVLDSDQRLALAVMNKNNDDYLKDPDWLTKWGAPAMIMVIMIILLLSIFFITQYTSAAINASVSPLTSSTNTLSRAIDAYAAGNCSGLPAVPRPPG
jgi:hypothetical protein